MPFKFSIFSTRVSKWLLGLLVATLALALSVGLSPANATAAAAPGSRAIGTAELVGSADVGDLVRLDGASAAAAARLLGDPVEDLSRRTESSQFFANPDGTVTQKSFSAPVMVRRGDGWTDVDYNLAVQQDGSYAPNAGPVDVTVGGGGSDPVATVKFDDGSWASVSWPGKLPAPRVVGGTATYEVSDGVDLLVVVTARGLSTRIRLNKAPTVGDPKYTLELATNKIDVTQDAEGDIAFERTIDGKTVASDARLVAWADMRDAGGDPVEVVPVEGVLGARSVDGTVSERDVVLEAPKSIVDDTATEYPVIIDPDIEAVSGTEDAWMRSGTVANYGNDYRLLVGPIQSQQNSHPTHTFIRWSNTELAGQTIIAADLHLFQYHAGSCSPRRMNIHRIDATPWDENTVTWANKPDGVATTGISTSLTVNVGGDGCAPNGYIQASVLNMVQGWADGPANGGFINNGLTMNVPAGNANDYSYERRFCSSEPDTTTSSCTSVTRVPYLTVTTDGDPDAPTSLGIVNPSADQAPLPCGSSLGNTNGLPSVQAVVTDPDGDVVTPYFQWSAGSTVVPGNPEVVDIPKPSGGTASAVLPIGTGGGVFSFRARAKDSFDQYGPYSSSCSFTIDRALAGNPLLDDLPASWDANVSYNITFLPGGDDVSKTVGYSFTLNSAIAPPSPQYVVAPGATHVQAITPNPALGFNQKLRLWAYNSSGAVSAVPDVRTIIIF